MKMDLLTNATVVDDAIRFVSQKSIDKEESKDEPGYDEGKDQLEEEQGEEIHGEMITISQVF